MRRCRRGSAGASAPSGGGDFDAVRRRSRPAAPKRRRTVAVDRPVEIAAEGPQRQRRRLGGRGAGGQTRAASPAASAASSAARRRAGRSGRASIDVADEIVRAPAPRAAPRPALCGARPAAPRADRALLERRARRLQLVERLLVRRDAVAIELGERRDGPRRLAEAPEVRRREQQPQIARLAELVDLDQPRAQLRPLRALGRSAAPACARRSPSAPSATFAASASTASALRP